MGMPGAAFNRQKSHCLPGGLIENLFKLVFCTYSAIFLLCAVKHGSTYAFYAGKILNRLGKKKLFLISDVLCLKILCCDYWPCNRKLCSGEEKKEEKNKYT